MKYIMFLLGLTLFMHLFQPTYFYGKSDDVELSAFSSDSLLQHNPLVINNKLDSANWDKVCVVEAGRPSYYLNNRIVLPQ